VNKDEYKITFQHLMHRVNNNQPLECVLLSLSNKIRYSS